MVFRQEVQLALGPLEEAFAKEHARTDGDLRLDDMIAGAKGVGIGIEEDRNTGLLVILEEMPAYRRQDDAGQEDVAQEGHLDAADEEHAEGNGQEDETRPQVRLFQDQEKGNPDVEADGQDLAPCVELAYAVAEDRCRADDHDELGKFRRLQRDRAELDPALGAQGRRTDEHDGDQHEQVDDVQGLGVFLQLRIIEAAEKEDDHQVDDKSRPLFCDEVVVDGPFIDMRRTADDAQADADDEEAHDEHDFI